MNESTNDRTNELANERRNVRTNEPTSACRTYAWKNECFIEWIDETLNGRTKEAYMLDLCWTYAELYAEQFSLNLCWIYAGLMLNLCWTYAGFMLDLCWTYAGLMLDYQDLHREACFDTVT